MYINNRRAENQCMHGLYKMFVPCIYQFWIFKVIRYYRYNTHHYTCMERLIHIVCAVVEYVLHPSVS